MKKNGTVETVLATFRDELIQYEGLVLKRQAVHNELLSVDDQLNQSRRHLQSRMAQAFDNDASQPEENTTSPAQPSPSSKKGTDFPELKGFGLHPKKAQSFKRFVKILRNGEEHASVLSKKLGLSQSAIMFHVSQGIKIGLFKRVKKGTFALA